MLTMLNNYRPLFVIRQPSVSVRRAVKVGGDDWEKQPGTTVASRRAGKKAKKNKKPDANH